MTPDPIYRRLQRLPKVELHRHWEASMRLTTLLDIAKDYGIEMPEYDVETLRPFVQVMPGEPHSMQHFLGKFTMLRQFYRSIEVIDRMTREIIIDADDDNVRYMELRFTPKALCNITQCGVSEMIQLVCNAAREASENREIIVKLIASMNRHESVQFGEQVMRAAIDHKDDGIVGLDLAGNEQMSGLPFREVFREAKQEGLGVTIHAGEWNGPNSISEAVNNLGADRIGHGVRVVEDPEIINILTEREIMLEVCPSSNVLSGICPSLSEHPLPEMMRHNLPITLNTDDPIICNINLTDELYYTVTHMNVSIEEIKQVIIRGAQASFLPDVERNALVAKFQGWLAEDSDAS